MIVTAVIRPAVRPLVGRLLCVFVCLGTPLRTYSSDVDYLRDVKPMLVRCTPCHGALRQKNELRLDTAELIRKGGVGGPAVTAGNGTGSLLIDAVLGRDGTPRMPPEGEGEPLRPEQVATLAAWIDQGAQAPPEETPADPRSHWAYIPPQRPTVPQIPGDEWSRNPIDAFLALEHHSRGLTPAPPADRGTLLRRVTIDLTGLPPTQSELHDFLADDSSDAYEQVVDRLLRSPRYAERWGRHWMDIWRYSDWYGSRGGNELRNSRRHIWRWRDWIVESIEADTGYDQMLREMLAGDELSPGDLQVQRAGGFLGRNYYVFNRHVWIQDTVEFTGMALLGVTFKCARCHDHKYDPISQEEYYRFRAFFEPHQVRTDPMAGRSEKLSGNQPAMAPPGATLAHGHDVIFDAQPDAPTYLLARGNEKDPVTDRPLAPGVPGVLDSRELAITPQPLPIEAFYPELRPEYRDELVTAARRKADAADAALHAAREEIDRLGRRPANWEAEEPARTESAAGDPFLLENFAQPRPGTWQVLSGKWEHADGKLVQTQVGSFLTMLTRDTHPRDFQARIRYRTLEAGSIHSVGIGFDVSENARDWQAVYTATNNVTSTVQAFHRRAGIETYPAAGIVPHPFKLNDTLSVDLAVRDSLLNVWVDGKLKLAYPLPVDRQPGRFALWLHSATAEFHELRIEPLAPHSRLATETTQALPSPYGLTTPADFEQHRLALQRQLPQLQEALEQSRAEADSIAARVAAEVAKYSPASPDEAARLALAAGKAERGLAAVKAAGAVGEAERQLTLAQAALQPGDEPTQKRLAEAEAKLNAARAALSEAQAKLSAEDPGYTPLGTAYPATTSGRRRALAEWITRRENPLAARVAVNHIWLRHFGSALVPSVFNFGLNGKRPTHPQLLDWLAVEFMERGWSTRHMHRLMVTSAAYRMQSAESGPADPNLQLDRENRWYWRANPRRMEAEVVRDGLLHLAGRLDPARSGPDLEPGLSDAVPRRSLYFRHTPDDRALLLELFDAANASECYQRDESIVPQQALALANGLFAQEQSRMIAGALRGPGEPPTAAEFIERAFEHLLTRGPTPAERRLCEQHLLDQRARYQGATGLTRVTTGTAAQVKPAADPLRRAEESLIHVLLNYHEFVTVR